MTGARWHLPALGLVAASVAWFARDTVAGGATWLVAITVASAGCGVAIERIIGQRASAGITVTTGLAALLIASTALARLGWLGAWVQFAIVIGGIAAAAIPASGSPPGSRAPPPGDGMGAGPGDALTGAVGSVAALLVIVLAFVHPDAVQDDGWNHAFVIKRLWDLGTLGGGAQQAGLQLIGEAYVAWMTGAATADTFGAGLCAVLVILVVACELRSSDVGSANLLFVIAVITVVLRPARGAEWPATLLHLTAILSLRTAIATRRIAWHTLIAALALGLLRNECWLIAAPYMLAAIALPRLDRPAARSVTTALVAWMVTVVAVLHLTGVGAGPAIIKAILLLGAVPLGGLLLRLLGTAGWRSATAAMCVAVAGYQLALASYAVPPSVHSADITFGAWTAFGLAILVTSELASPARATPYLRIGAVSLAIALLAAGNLLLPMFRTGDTSQIANRFVDAIAGWRERRLSRRERASEDIHRAQLRVPPGARVGFWGRNAALLEHGRNPILDESLDAGQLRPITTANLGDREWLIVEDLATTSVRDPWLPGRVYTPAIEHVRDRLELTASIGRVHVYHVLRPTAAAARGAPIPDQRAPSWDGEGAEPSSAASAASAASPK